jgi:hypothetical protein
MGGIAQQNGMIPKCIGGVSDHVHLLISLPTRLAVANAVQLIKTGSSAWIHQTFQICETRRTFRREIPLGLAVPGHTVPYGTVLSRDAFPGTSCQATIAPSLRDKNIRPSKYLALSQRLWVETLAKFFDLFGFGAIKHPKFC